MPYLHGRHRSDHLRLPTEASFAAISETTIAAIAPAGRGTVDVTVTTPGTSATSEADRFTYGAPTVLTAAASSITRTSATLNPTVSLNGVEVSECKFEWGTTTSNGSSASCSSLPGSGNSSVAASATLTGLSNKTTYHHRVSATASAAQTKGSDRTFTAASVHVYKNGTIGAEGKKVRTITCGNLKFAYSTSRALANWKVRSADLDSQETEGPGLRCPGTHRSQEPVANP